MSPRAGIVPFHWSASICREARCYSVRTLFLIVYSDQQDLYTFSDILDFGLKIFIWDICGCVHCFLFGFLAKILTKTTVFHSLFTKLRRLLGVLFTVDKGNSSCK